MTAPVPVMWELTLGWYGDRLDPAWSPPTVDHLQGLLDAVGLTDPFWRLTLVLVVGTQTDYRNLRISFSFNPV